MKISAHLEFDTFGEAEKVFRHLGMLDVPLSPTEKLTQGHSVHSDVTKKLNGTGDIQSSETSSADQPKQQAAAASEITLDDMKTALRAYIGKAGGRTAGTAREILLHHGIPGGKITDVKPEQFAVLKRAFETAGPEQPLGKSV